MIRRSACRRTSNFSTRAYVSLHHHTHPAVFHDACVCALCSAAHLLSYQPGLHHPPLPTSASTAHPHPRRHLPSLDTKPGGFQSQLFASHLTAGAAARMVRVWRDVADGFDFSASVRGQGADGARNPLGMHSGAHTLKREQRQAMRLARQGRRDARKAERRGVSQRLTTSQCAKEEPQA